MNILKGRGFLILMVVVFFLISFFYELYFILPLMWIETYDVMLSSTVSGFEIVSSSLGWDFFYVELSSLIFIFMIVYIVKKNSISAKIGLLFMVVMFVITVVSNFIISLSNSNYAVYNFFEVELIVPEGIQNGLSTNIVNMGVVLSIIFSLYFIMIILKEKKYN
jgi:hypothetical protein